MSVITNIGIALPPHKQAQMDVFEAVKECHTQSPTEARSLRFIYSTSGIAYRYSAVPDFSTPNNTQLFNFATEDECTLTSRLAIYHKQALPLAKEAIHNCLNGTSPQEITHLITVSCTGISAPGLDLELVRELGLNKNIYRTSVNFMGCYAAIHALKQAYYIAQVEPTAKVMVVCVELCTLHFQKNKQPDNLTSTAIFGDGAAAALVCGQGKGLAIRNFYSNVLTDGWQDMAWHISETGFLMTLTSQVPVLLQQHCKQLITQALEHYKLTDAMPIEYVVHPGGRKILEAVSHALTLPKEHLAHSYDVLHNYGNMSSPTILFVLQQKLLNNNNTNPHIALAFGPGLTLETMHIQHV
jgi:predicted naringenin-chalcone synthase